MIYDCRDPQQMVSALALNELFPPALHYWQAIKTDRLPSRHEIDPIDIPDLLPNIMLLDVLESGRDFRYRLAGTAIERNFGASIKDLTLGAIVQSFPSVKPILDVKINCVQTASPYACDAAVFTHFGTKKQVYCIAMPLSDDGVTVSQIFAIGILERITMPAGLAR
jgi:hypothetical protein